MRAHTYNSIADIDPLQWDSLLGGNNVVNSHAFLRAVEGSRINDCRFFYPVVYDGDTMVAHASVCTISTALDLCAQGFVRHATDTIRRRLPSFLVFRWLESGSPVALGNTICFLGDAPRHETLSLICAEMERLAREQRLAMVLLRDFYDNDTTFYDALTTSGYSRVPSLPDTRMSIQWNTFDEYLNSMRSKYRWKATKRIDALRHDHVTIEVLAEFGDHADVFAGLWRNVYDNAKEYRRERLTADFFRNISAQLKEKSNAIYISKDGIPLAFSLLISNGDTLISAFTGLNYQYNQKYALYFNLLYKTIELAIVRKMIRVDFGITTLVPKKEVGASVAPIHVYMKHFHPLINRIVPAAFAFMLPKQDTTECSVFRQFQKPNTDAREASRTRQEALA